MTRRIEDIRFDCLRNALYHTARRRTFEALARTMNFLVVVFGTAAFGNILTNWGITPGYLGAAAAIIGALQLTFDFAGKAGDHTQLQKNYYDVLADTEANPNPDEKAIAEFDARLTRIYANEPPTMRAIDTKAYNDALDALGDYRSEDRLYIPIWQRGPLASLIAFEGYEYKPRERA